MKQLLLIFISVFLLNACSHDVPFAYKMDIQQGNVIKQQQIDKVKLGMTKEEVEDILGLPVSRGSFNQKRWDYVYYLKKNRKPVDERKLTVYFNDAGLVSSLVHAGPPSDP